MLGYEGSVGELEADCVFDEGRIEFDGDAWAVLAAAAAGGDEDGVGFAFGGDLRDSRGPEFGVVVGECGGVSDENLVSELAGLGGDGGDSAAEDEQGNGSFAAEIAGCLS